MVGSTPPMGLDKKKKKLDKCIIWDPMPLCKRVQQRTDTNSTEEDERHQTQQRRRPERVHPSKKLKKLDNCNAIEPNIVLFMCPVTD